ncbi:unnamed protein product [Paramecium sonneborni]|uniref:PX domain-containing protein n=1 Tax=Paramecium sonneborni TaxID=65129 RepID=A0A8S1NEV6_9CILI|nr:unnamed protein product [Paramecium sonneborni]
MDSNSPISASIISHRSDPNDDAIYYMIQVKNKTSDVWQLEKRFSQFEDLAKKLKVLFGEQLPSLPKKKYITFLVGKTPEDIEKRKAGLDEFIQNLASRQEVVASEPLKQFLEIERNAKEIIVNPPKLIFEFKGFLHGIRDFTISSEQGLMFVITSDCSVINRLDAYLTNMKAPWESEKGDQALIPVGCVECWLQQENGEFQRLWVKMYNSQAITCYWDSVASVLLVGLDSGSINYLYVPEKEGYKKFTESMEIEQHTDRVMGLYYDTKRKYLHSVSKDRKYRILNLRKGILVEDIEPGQYELTCLLGSDERKKTFVGDRHGEIFIYDIEKKKPKLIIKIPTTQLFIRGFFIDNQRNYLFSISHENGVILIIDIQLPGREQYSKEVAQLNGKSKSREIGWSAKRGEIYVGNIDGTVTIWDARKSKQLYVLKAHDSDITKLQWLDADQTLLTSAKDKVIKVWSMPQHWRDPNIVEKELEQDQLQAKQQSSDLIYKKAQQQFQQKFQDDEDDDMAIWHKDQQRHSDTKYEDIVELK